MVVVMCQGDRSLYWIIVGSVGGMFGDDDDIRAPFEPVISCDMSTA